MTDPSGAYVWRDDETMGVPASGRHMVKKSDIRAWALQIEAQAAQAAGYQATSETSLAIGAGSASFTTQSSKAFLPGMFVLALSDADPTNYMTGTVTSYSDTTLVVDVTSFGGSGTLADWTISIAGAPSAVEGPAGVSGTSRAVSARVAGAAATIASGLENGDTFNGVVLVTNDIVFLPAQADASENGLYVVQASGAATRHSDFASFDDHPGVVVSVQEGDGYAGSIWQCVALKGGVLATTAIRFRRLGDDVPIVRPDAVVPVLIIAGESGGFGEGANTALTEAQRQRRHALQIFNPEANVFESLHIGVSSINNQPFRNGSGYHGVEEELATLTEAGYFGFPQFFVIKAPNGGTVAKDWSWRPETFVWNEFRSQVSTGLTQLRAMGKVPMPFIFWSLGINDVLNFAFYGSTPFGGYTLTTGIMALDEADTASESLDIFRSMWAVIGQQCPVFIDSLRPNYSAVKSAYQAMIAANAGLPLHLIDADTCGANSHLLDVNHLDATGLQLLCDEMAITIQDALVGYATAPQVKRLTWDQPPYRNPGLQVYNHNTQLKPMLIAAGQNRSALGTIGTNTGKWVFEVYNDATSGANNLYIGISARDFDLLRSSSRIGSLGHGCSTTSGTGAVTVSNFSAGTALSSPCLATATHYNMVAVDFDAGKVWFGVDGTFNGNPAAGTGAAATFTPGSRLYYPAVTIFGNDTQVASIRGGSDMVSTLPSGFGRWADAAKVLTPAIVRSPFAYGTPTVGSTIYCNPGIWDGIGPLSHRFQFQRNGLDVRGANDPFHVVMLDDVDQLMGWSVTASTVGIGAATASTSNTLMGLIADTPGAFDPGSAAPGMVFTTSNRRASGGTVPINGGGITSVRSIDGYATGKWHYEFKVISQVATNQIYIGVCDDTADALAMDQLPLNSAAVRADNFNQASGTFSVNTPGMGTTVENTVIDLDIDVDNKKAWVSVNGTPIRGDPAAGTSPTFTWTGDFTVYALIGLAAAVSGTVIERVISSLTYSPPAGFSVAD